MAFISTAAFDAITDIADSDTETEIRTGIFVQTAETRAEQRIGSLSDERIEEMGGAEEIKDEIEMLGPYWLAILGDSSQRFEAFRTPAQLGAILPLEADCLFSDPSDIQIGQVDVLDKDMFDLNSIKDTASGLFRAKLTDFYRTGPDNLYLYGAFRIDIKGQRPLEEMELMAASLGTAENHHYLRLNALQEAAPSVMVIENDTLRYLMAEELYRDVMNANKRDIVLGIIDGLRQAGVEVQTIEERKERINRVTSSLMDKAGDITPYQLELIEKIINTRQDDLLIMTPKDMGKGIAP